MRSASVETTSQEARTDELTGLPNRRALIEELERRSGATSASRWCSPT